MVVKKDTVDNSGVWTQGADEHTLRCDAGDYAGGSTYTVTYVHADFIKAWDTIGLYGLVDGEYASGDIEYAANLLAAARLQLDILKYPKITFAIKLVDLSELPGFSFETLLLGSTVKVIDEELGLEFTDSIIMIRRPDYADMMSLEIELSNRVITLGDLL